MFRKNTSGLFFANDVTEANNDWKLSQILLITSLLKSQKLNKLSHSLLLILFSQNRSCRFKTLL
jgi:hypothetical protein